MNLTALLENIKKGDKCSFEKLYCKAFKDMYSYALYLTKGDKNMAYDAVVNSFIKIWVNRKKIQIHSSLKHYLFLMIRNNVIDHYRKKKLNIIELQDDLEIPSTEGSCEDTSNYDTLYEELNKLPYQQLKILKMKVFESYSYKNIASKLQISVNTVKTHIYRARKNLKKNLNVNDK